MALAGALGSSSLELSKAPFLAATTGFFGITSGSSSEEADSISAGFFLD